MKHCICIICMMHSNRSKWNAVNWIIAVMYSHVSTRIQSIINSGHHIHTHSQGQKQHQHVWMEQTDFELWIHPTARSPISCICTLSILQYDHAYTHEQHTHAARKVHTKPPAWPPRAAVVAAILPSVPDISTWISIHVHVYICCIIRTNIGENVQDKSQGSTKIRM